jgi:hypothetical protein
MAKNKAFQAAEKKIAEALRTGATELDLSCDQMKSQREMHRKKKDERGLC